MSSFSIWHLLTTWLLLLIFSTISVKSQNTSLNDSLSPYFADNGTDNWSYEGKFWKFCYLFIIVTYSFLVT